MARKPTKVKTANPFLEAIQFVGTALKEQGTAYETHIYINNNWAISNNGILAIGTPISWPSLTTPNYFQFANALAKCGNDWEIAVIAPPLDADPTLSHQSKLRISQGKFKAFVPCIDPVQIAMPTVDAPIAVINNNFRKALEAVAMLANDNGQSVIEASILMNGQSIVGTDRILIIEYWHGCDLPPGLALPKAFAVALCKISKNLKAFGFSANSATFYFEDDSFIKTQLFADSWPDINAIMERGSNPQPVPKGLWDAVKAVESFSPDNLVHFDAGILRSHSDSNAGASFEVSGLPKGPIFNIKYLKLIEGLATSIDFFAGNATMFFGDSVRGAVANRV